MSPQSPQTTQTSDIRSVRAGTLAKEKPVGVVVVVGWGWGVEGGEKPFPAA